MESMECHACSESLGADAKFCSNCGVKVDMSAIDVAAAVVVAETKAETVKRYAKTAAVDVVDAGRAAMKAPLGKEVAAGAAIGAVLAIPIPFIGPLTGAVVGSGIVLYKKYWKS